MDLAYVVCGRQDVYFEYKLESWDHAARDLIILEAEKVIQNIDRESISYIDPYNIIAYANTELMKEILLMQNL